MNIGSALVLAQDTAASAQQSWFADFDSDSRFAITIIVIGCLTAIIITLIGATAGAHKHAAEARLKENLIDRGMDSDEIARVVEATPPTDFLQRLASKKR